MTPNNGPRARDVQPGDVVWVELPYSEVCMHLRVAGQIRPIQVLAEGAQILTDNGTPFSIPITHAEAGIHERATGTGPQWSAYEHPASTRAATTETDSEHVVTPARRLESRESRDSH